MAKQRYIIQLTALAPLLISPMQTLGNYRFSDTVIPGRTWRGAVAAALQQDEPDIFNDIFLNRPSEAQPAFGSLIPAVDAQDTSLPPTLLACKYHPGEQDHIIFDSLIRQYAYQKVMASGNTLMWIDEMLCPACGEPTERYEEFSIPPIQMVTTHVGINRQRRVAEEAILYSREGVQADSDYYGYIDIPEDLTHTLTVALIGREFYLGANRSRGMGRVVISNLYPDESHLYLEDRMFKLNETIEQWFDFYRLQTGIASDHLRFAQLKQFFTLSIRGEALLIRDGTSVDAPDLSNIGAVIEAQWTHWVPVGGWHSASKLPRRTQMSVSGVYLCRFESESDFQALANLETEGIGLMREQGFGQVSICSPIHYQETGLIPRGQ